MIKWTLSLSVIRNRIIGPVFQALYIHSKKQKKKKKKRIRGNTSLHVGLVCSWHLPAEASSPRRKTQRGIGEISRDDGNWWTQGTSMNILLWTAIAMRNGPRAGEKIDSRPICWRSSNIKGLLRSRRPDWIPIPSARTADSEELVFSYRYW